MGELELSEILLARLAGWDAVKQARGLVPQVTASDWQPPRLQGTVRDGGANLRSGLVINSASDAENLCPCRQSRQRGIICAHSVAIGLHYLRNRAVTSSEPEKKTGLAPQTKSASRPAAKALRRAQPGEEGEPLEIFLILPPNLPDALGRDKVMLCAEGKWTRGRAPLNALPLTVPFTLTDQDAALLDTLELFAEGDTPAMLMLNTSQFVELLPALMDHPGVTIGRTQSIQLTAEPWRLQIRATLEPSGELSLRLVGTLPPGSVLFAGKMARDPRRAVWVFSAGKIQPINLPASLQDLARGPVLIPRTRVPLFLNLDWPALVRDCDVQADFALTDFSLEPGRPEFKLHLAGGLAQLQGRIECSYDDKPVTELPKDGLWLPDPSSPTRYFTRNIEAEQAAIARLQRSGFTGPDAQGLYHLKGQNLVLNFFAREFPRLEKEWDVTLEERLDRSTRQNLERIEPSFQITTSGEQWFDLSIAYNTPGGERFAAADIQRLLLSGQGHTRLKNGKFALIDTGAVEELQEVILDCAPVQREGSYRMGNSQAGFLEATLRQQPAWQVQAPAAWTQRSAQHRGEAGFTPPALGDLEAVLRPYQKQGVGWLAFLRANGFGGILADEMGLGKTLQILAHFFSLGDRATLRRPPHLVVCPTSLVWNWIAETKKFTPQLKVLALHGPARHELFSQIPSHDLVVTSYAVLRRDAELYQGLEFDTVVLDEAQHVKNRQTQSAQAVKAIRSAHRVVLTGTPIENSVLDLWSIFDFLMPGYLGSAQDFRDRYEQPIVRDKNAAVQARLARRLRPFLLRRLKREVAQDLPEKIEQVSYCDLSPDQSALYQQILEASRREIVNAVEANGLAKSRMLVLTTLLRLRQICCDLRLLKIEATPDAEPAVPAADAAATPSRSNSGKTELFDELLEEILDGGHRVLVFSQFTTMLGLLRESLVAQNIEFCYLDGATRDRAQVVERFQTGSQVPVFLISLKAGGVGLNLTGADTVIHFDPWWNPAVEAQATDRAHRIGQKKVVTSYKLITRGTIEEKILNLQTRKRALTQELLGGEEQLVAALDWNEIQDLLAG